MKVEYKIYRRFKDSQDYESFIRCCDESKCYPWSILTLKQIYHRQTRTPPVHHRGQPQYDCSWTYSDLNRDLVDTWRTWMALKYDISIPVAIVYRSENIA